MSAAVIATTLGRATIADLERVPEKAELVNGRIEYLMATGYLPGRIGGRIYRKLDEHVETIGRGAALPDNVGFVIEMIASGRESFCPDASYFAGLMPANPMKFVNGPPTFAVEVRSENDYGDAAERDMADKRSDYFEAGTIVVWDVDPVAQSIACFRKGDHRTPGVVFTRGQSADAEPAVPGWRLDTEWLFS